MKTIQKRFMSGMAVTILMIAGAAAIAKKPWYENVEKNAEPELAETTVEQEKGPADIIFWYDDASYKEFFAQAAERFYEESGVIVDVRYVDVLDYTGEIYQITMEGNAFPDVYLLSAEQLEEAYLYGVAAENADAATCQSVSERALEAASYEGKLLGYPLSYNVCLFLYQNGYFEKEPESLQEIITYSDENDPPENVEYLIEWDVNDPFYDFPFVSNSVTFTKENPENMDVSYDEGLYNEDLTFFENMLESISVDVDTVSEETVIRNFKEGKTLCAILDSDSLSQLSGLEYNMMELPKLSDTLDATSCALTDLVVVNDFSTKTETASAFAEYLTLTMPEELYALTGHYPVKLSEQADATEKIAYQAYEHAILAPDSQDADEFWVKLKETIVQFFQ